MDPRTGHIYPPEQIDALPPKKRARLVTIPQSALATVEAMGPDARKAWARDRQDCACGHRRAAHAKHGSGACKSSLTHPGGRCPCRRFRLSAA